MIKTAFVLGAGLGTRLRPLTEAWPKPLLSLGGRPLITYAFDHLIPLGVDRIIINTHHCAHRYEEVFPDHHWRGILLHFRHEPIRLETAGGLKNIEDLWTESGPLLVYNGDILSDLPLSALVERHQHAGTDVTLALRTQGTPLNVGIDSEGFVQDLRDVRGISGLTPTLFTGIYLIERPFLQRLTPGRVESVIDVFLRMLQSGGKDGQIAGAVIDSGSWCDIGTLDEFRRMEAALTTEQMK